MTEIKIMVNGAKAEAKVTGTLTSGMVGIPVRITYDEQWAGLQKMAVFRAGGLSLPVENPDDRTTVPWEIMRKKYCALQIGVYGCNTAGDIVIPTIWADCGTIEPGTEIPDGAPTPPPTPLPWDTAVDAAGRAEQAAEQAADSAALCAHSAEDAQRAETAADAAAGHAQAASDSQTAAAGHAQAASTDAGTASQALADLLRMLGTDIATLVGGKIPMSQIPATATQEVYEVTSEDQLTTLIAQRGDLAEVVSEVNGEKTIVKSFQLLGNGDPIVRDNWIVWGTSYAVQAGNATTADNAENANKINGHRMVEMAREAFETAVKDPETFYLIYDPASEV